MTYIKPSVKIQDKKGHGWNIEMLNEYKTKEQIVFFFIFKTQMGRNVQWVSGLSF